MENKTINLAVVAQIADALGELKKDVVFVGGAVVSVYTDDPAADEIRPTKDVDLTLHISGLKQWKDLQTELAKRGFQPDPTSQYLGRFVFNKIPVDVLSTVDSPLGPANPWFKIGLENVLTQVVNGQSIQVLSAPCYIASKFEAYHNRGKDYRSSHDIEDIVYIVDNRLNISEEIANDQAEVRSFIKEQFNRLIEKRLLDEVLVTHIHPIMLAERLPMVKDKIQRILDI